MLSQFQFHFIGWLSGLQTLNYDLTASYLNLVVNYICLMVLLSRVEDRKAVLGLFNAAYELQHGHSETTFPRLGQMIVDYDIPLKKLAEDFTPLARVWCWIFRVVK